MDETMEVDTGMQYVPMPEPQPAPAPYEPVPAMSMPAPSVLQPQSQAGPSTGAVRDFRDIAVKIHIRKPEKDAWQYVGRGLVTQEFTGHSSRVVVRAMNSGKTLTTFSETSDLQAEKRGNFVVVGCVEGQRVVSWSLNALNNSETLRLLASIELACYRSKQAIANPRTLSKGRRRIERIIKDDRRRRHRMRKDQEAMVDLFSRQNLAETSSKDESVASS